MNCLFFLTLKSLKGKKDSFAHFSTLVSILGVSVGVAAVIVVMGVMSGFDEELQNRILSFKPHISIISWEKFTYPVPWEKKIRSPEITAIYPVIWGEGMLKTLADVPLSKGVIIKGIPWDKLADLKIKLNYKGRGLIVGKGLARRLGVKRGDKLFLLTTRLEGKILPVAGIAETGIYQFDSSLVLLPLAQAQKLLGMEGEISGIDIKIKNPQRVEEVRKYLEKFVPKNFSVLTWKETEKTLFAALRMEKLTMFTIMSLILIVATLSITASLILKVMEKQKDVGILRALGFTPREIGKIFLYQGLLIGITGGVIGEIIALVLELLIKYRKIVSLPQEIYFLSYLPVKIDPLMFLWIMLFSVFTSLLATILPSYRASHIEVSRALRYE